MVNILIKYGERKKDEQDELGNNGLYISFNNSHTTLI